MKNSTQESTINTSTLFREFLDYLVGIGYSDSIENLLEGVFQRAFFDEFIYFLGKRKKASNSIVEHIKNELM